MLALGQEWASTETALLGLKQGVFVINTIEVVKGHAVPDSSDFPPSILSHISLGTNDYPRAKAFYDAVLAALQIKQVMRHGESAAYGRAFPEFWIGRPLDGGRAAPGNGTHVCFRANSPAEVDAFHAKALAMGGQCDGPPGLRPHYTPTYYAAFVRDLDGHKIEAMCFAEVGG